MMTWEALGDLAWNDPKGYRTVIFDVIFFLKRVGGGALFMFAFIFIIQSYENSLGY